MKFIITAVFGPLLLAGTASAQTTNSEKSAQKIGAALETVSAIAKIIGRKKSKSPNTQQTAATKEADQKTGNLKPGDIAPNAKYLDVDEFFPFNGGAAVVRKGGSMALIDTGANFIVPFNKYDLTSPVLVEVSLGSVGSNAQKIWTPTGLFELRDGSQYINAKGQIVVKRDSPYVDRETIWKKKGYGIVGAMSDGLVCAVKKDAYGVPKYGFFDASGREVIPAQFTNRPSDFLNGFATVEPVDHSEFYYAFINRKGEVVIKIKNINYGSAGFKVFSYQGYSFAMNQVMDTTGKVISEDDFLKQFGINDAAKKRIGVSLDDKKALIKDRKLRVIAQDFTGQNQNTQGFINLQTKKFSGFYFNEHPLIYFDEKAKLSYAEVVLGLDKGGLQIKRKGYINEDGLFVIVQAQAASKW